MKVDANCDGTVDWVRKHCVSKEHYVVNQTTSQLSFVVNLGRVLFLHVAGDSTQGCYDK